ncbi:MAG TPA: hypothetical protein VMD59_21305, partial [Acidimicrobiales bacterium]|nr:hypothetical protein [Acidimicrobiales bacterium]
MFAMVSGSSGNNDIHITLTHTTALELAGAALFVLELVIALMAYQESNRFRWQHGTTPGISSSTWALLGFVISVLVFLPLWRAQVATLRKLGRTRNDPPVGAWPGAAGVPPGIRAMSGARNPSGGYGPNPEQLIAPGVANTTPRVENPSMPGLAPAAAGPSSGFAAGTAAPGGPELAATNGAAARANGAGSTTAGVSIGFVPATSPAHIGGGAAGTQGGGLAGAGGAAASGAIAGASAPAGLSAAGLAGAPGSAATGVATADDVAASAGGAANEGVAATDGGAANEGVAASAGGAANEGVAATDGGAANEGVAATDSGAASGGGAAN